jgi:predicted Zn finger-like uncharacterized protein
MVVVCPECSTKFSLDESRISGPTVKVRCSRCRHVFQISREGQVVAPVPTPPVKKTPEAPPREEVREEIPVRAQPEPVEPPLAPAKEAVSEEAVLSQPAAAAGAEAPAPPPQKRRHWLWLPALLLAIVVLMGLGWRAWQGDLPGPLKPLADLVQRLKGNPGPAKPPATPTGPEAKAPAPAPTVVTPPPPPVPAADLADLGVDWAQAHYQGLVNDKGGGQLLLIQGEVINKGKSPRGPIRLKATLTDAQHRPLREEVVYAGTSLTDSEVKTLPPEEIKVWLAQPGGRSQQRVLKPGEREPFSVVFFGVPNNLAETQSGFQLVVVEGPVAK